MKVIEHLQKAKSTLFSVEILPPLKGKGIRSIWDILDPLITGRNMFTKNGRMDCLKNFLFANGPER
jgi:hypothetical protein